jgi:hypothetical protein
MKILINFLLIFQFALLPHVAQAQETNKYWQMDTQKAAEVLRSYGGDVSFDDVSLLNTSKEEFAVLVTNSKHKNKGVFSMKLPYITEDFKLQLEIQKGQFVLQGKHKGRNTYIRHVVSYNPSRPEEFKNNLMQKMDLVLKQIEFSGYYTDVSNKKGRSVAMRLTPEEKRANTSCWVQIAVHFILWTVIGLTNHARVENEAVIPWVVFVSEIVLIAISVIALMANAVNETGVTFFGCDVVTFFSTAGGIATIFSKKDKSQLKFYE